MIVALSIALIGAVGGASLGLGLRNWRKAAVAALVGAVSFSIANFIGFVIQLSLWGSEPPLLAGLFTGAIIGIILGAPKARRRARLTTKHDTPVEESLLIRQRLRNLCELAIAIGQKNGVLGNYKKVDKTEPKVAQKPINDNAMIPSMTAKKPQGFRDVR